MIPGQTVLRVRRGIAGQYQIDAVTDLGLISFAGSQYGGPVVMITQTGKQVFVTNPGRYGAKFNPDWVRRFLED